MASRSVSRVFWLAMGRSLVTHFILSMEMFYSAQTQVGTKNSMQARLSSMLPGLHLGPDRLPQIQLHHRLLFV